MAENDLILPDKQDFSAWYNELLQIAEIMDVRYPVKGLYVWHPFGFAIRKHVYNIIRDLLDIDHMETMFPLLIPENEFMKEAEHIKGFEDEVYWVTHGGLSPLDVKLALRPTSETAIYPMYKLWIRSHADLPLKLYQIVNTFRYETKHTRPLIRLREITSFKEAHTVHDNWDEAATQVDEAIKRYIEFYQRLAIPVLVSKRPDWDKFPGADYTIATDALMPDGKTLQVGTAHHLGNNFAKTFDIKYENKLGEQVYVNQTSYGISERSIAALISIHGDNKGLVLPPEVAPIQVIIIPIVFKHTNEVIDKCKELQIILKQAGIRAELDLTDIRPGAKYYKWEMKGVPIRLELGPRDLKKDVVISVRRDTGKKQEIQLDLLLCEIKKQLIEIHKNLLDKATDELYNHIFKSDNIEDIKQLLIDGIVLTWWCGEKECGLKMEEAFGTGMLGISTIQDNDDLGKCPICSRQSSLKIYVAKKY